MLYPHRTNLQANDLENLAASPYTVLDKPYLFSNRFSVSGGLDNGLIDAKRRVDEQGVQDNLYWYRKNIQQKNGELNG